MIPRPNPRGTPPCTPRRSERAATLFRISKPCWRVPRRCAAFIVEILRGIKPANLPVEMPTKYWLAVNLKTARQLGLEINQTILMRADQLIE